MNNNIAKGYIQYALDTMYIYKDNPLSNEQRKSLFYQLESAFDYLTEHEALSYYRSHDNFNSED